MAARGLSAAGGLLLWACSAAAVACELPYTAERLAFHVDAARAAWPSDLATVREVAARAADGAPCLDFVADPAQAGALRFLRGLHEALADGLQEPERASPWWTAAPAWPMEGRWAAAWGEPQIGRARPLPGEGWVVDGLPAERVGDGGHLVQRGQAGVDLRSAWVIDGHVPVELLRLDGQLQRTTYTLSWTETDELAIARQVPPRKKPTVAAGVVLIAVGGGLLAGHLVAAEQFRGLTEPESEGQVRSLGAAVNGLAIGAAAAGLAGASTLTWGVMIGDGAGIRFGVRF